MKPEEFASKPPCCDATSCQCSLNWCWPACRFELENLDDFGLWLRTITEIHMKWMVLKQAASILDKLQLVFKASLLWHSYHLYPSYQPRYSSYITSYHQNRLRFLFSTCHIQPFPSFTMPKIRFFWATRQRKTPGSTAGANTHGSFGGTAPCLGENPDSEWKWTKKIVPFQERGVWLLDFF